MYTFSVCHSGLILQSEGSSCSHQGGASSQLVPDGAVGGQGGKEKVLPGSAGQLGPHPTGRAAPRRCSGWWLCKVTATPGCRTWRWGCCEGRLGPLAAPVTKGKAGSFELQTRSTPPREGPEASGGQIWSPPPPRPRSSRPSCPLPAWGSKWMSGPGKGRLCPRVPHGLHTGGAACAPRGEGASQAPSPRVAPEAM